MSSNSQKPPVQRLKGLDSLFGEEPSRTQSLPLSHIKLPSRQPRRYFEPQKMEQLVHILESLRCGQIAYTKATAIARVKDEQLRQSLLEEAISQNLSLTQI